MQKKHLLFELTHPFLYLVQERQTFNVVNSGFWFDLQFVNPTVCLLQDLVQLLSRYGWQYLVECLKNDDIEHSKSKLII